MLTLEDTAKLLARIAEVHKTEMTDKKVELYHNFFSGWNVSHFELAKGIKQVLETSTFEPKPIEIRNAILSLRGYPASPEKAFALASEIILKHKDETKIINVQTKTGERLIPEGRFKAFAEAKKHKIAEAIKEFGYERLCSMYSYNPQGVNLSKEAFEAQKREFFAVYKNLISKILSKEYKPTEVPKLEAPKPQMMIEAHKQESSSDDLVPYMGSKMTKLDFAIKILGSETVNGCMREVISKGVTKHAYEEALNSLVCLAQQDLETGYQHREVA